MIINRTKKKKAGDVYIIKQNIWIFQVIIDESRLKCYDDLIPVLLTKYEQIISTKEGENESISRLPFPQIHSICFCFPHSINTFLYSNFSTLYNVLVRYGINANKIND